MRISRNFMTNECRVEKKLRKPEIRRKPIKNLEGAWGNKYVKREREILRTD